MIYPVTAPSQQVQRNQCICRRTRLTVTFAVELEDMPRVFIRTLQRMWQVHDGMYSAHALFVL